MARECLLMMVSGRKRIGKSNETIRTLVREYVLGKTPRKAIIFDTNNEYGTYVLHEKGQKSTVNIKRLGNTKNDIIKFSVHPDIEIRRVVPVAEDGTPLSGAEVEQMLINLVVYFRGGCIFLEDLRAVFGDSLPKNFAQLLYNNAHRNADLIMHVQTIGAIVPKIWSNTNIVRYHAQIDGIEESKQKLQSKYEIFKIADNIVRKQYAMGNIRFFLYVDTENSKIRMGKFYPLTTEMVNQAVTEYLQFNMRKVQAFEVKAKQQNKSAFEVAKEHLIKTYF